jgi:predicted acylesterase/phospholipase RssA
MNLIARRFGETELRAVAHEYKRGRLLFIGTTNLEAQLLVIWNMGAIATSGHPGALDLFRKIMIASASTPGAVPPVYFNVEADGKTYDEMHVDGGVMTQVFGVPLLVHEADAWRKADYTVTGRVYIIRNAHLGPEPEPVTPELSNIAGRSISTLIKTQGIGDIYRAYAVAASANFDFNHIAIPRDFNDIPKEPFDPVYMKKLYDLGFEMARQDLKWSKSPPGIK